jgi:hypothetical protein
VDRLPKWAQAVILVVVIGGSAFWLYYRFVIRSDQRMRMLTKTQWESNKAFDVTKELREKGKQKAGPSDYVVEATYVESEGRNEYRDATIRKAAKDGKVTEEVKAPRMTVVTASEVEFTVAVFDATCTTSDEAGNAKTETISGRKEMRLYVSGPGGGGGE